MTAISTHVLDAVLGRPAAGVAVTLESWSELLSFWNEIGRGTTDADGRCRSLGHERPAGIHRLTFKVGAYFAESGRNSIYPEISITFEVDGTTHYHIPLLLSDNSYTTYRGS